MTSKELTMRPPAYTRILLFAFFVFLSPANAAEVRIPWKGDYPHNSSKHWSKDNPYDSGFSNNFNNGAPEEYGQVKKDGELKAEVLLPKGTTGSVPFMIVMHGCGGMDTVTKEWAHRVADLLTTEGFGVLILDSFTSRFVDKSCGMPDFHWGRRRADDAYSALDYLIENKLAKPNEVYLMGYSNGGIATLISMTKKEEDHKYRFAAGFPIAPNCLPLSVKYGDFYSPMIVFIGDQDDANIPAPCRELGNRKRAVPLQLVEYKGANHGFVIKQAPKVLHGWTDAKGVAHMWHMNYNEVAERDMMQTIVSAIKTKKFGSKIEVRPVGSAELK